MEKLFRPLQQWAMKNQEERGVLVIATDKKKHGCVLTGTGLNVAQAIAKHASQNPEVHRILLMGLIAAHQEQSLLSLRARLIAWLLK